MAVLLCLLTPIPTFAAPKLAVPETEVSVGELIAGETAEAEFPIRNEGAEPLSITHVATSCGCTTPDYPRTLAPGEQGVLRVQLASNPLWSGRVQKAITVTSDDPEQPARMLHVVAQMRPLFRFSPVNPVVLNYKKGEVIRQVITVSAAADPGVKLLGLGTTTPETEARVLSAEASDPPGTARVEVTIRPPEQGGDITGHVTLQTSHPKVPTVPLILNLLSQDAVTVQPRAVYWASPGSSADSTRLITLMKRSGAFRVLAAETGHPALQVELHPPAAGVPDAKCQVPRGSDRSLYAAPGARHPAPARRAPAPGTRAQDAGTPDRYHEITLRCEGELPRGTTRGRLVILTDDPDSPRLEVPYQLIVP